MHTLTISRDNIDGDDNNRFVYNLPGSKNLEGAEIALVDLFMYYSWQNLNSQPLQNNILSIVWPAMTSGDGQTTTPQTQIPITIPDGLYEISDINSYLQQWCITNNYYLLNASTGEYVYFFQLQTNVTRYACQANSFAIPDLNTGLTGFPVGYSQPSGGFANSVYTPIGASGGLSTVSNQAPGWYFNKNFNDLVGFVGDTNFPSEGVFTTTAGFPTGNASIISSSAPNVQPNNVIYLNCNLVSNTYSSPSTFLYPVPAKSSIGALLSIEPPEFAWNKLMPGQASQIIMTFTTASGAPIKLQDPNVLITLIIRDNADKHPSIGHTTSNGQPSSMESQKLSRHPSNNNSNTPHHNLLRKWG